MNVTWSTAMCRYCLLSWNDRYLQYHQRLPFRTKPCLASSSEDVSKLGAWMRPIASRFFCLWVFLQLEGTPYTHRAPPNFSRPVFRMIDFAGPPWVTKPPNSKNIGHDGFPLTGTWPRMLNPVPPRRNEMITGYMATLQLIGFRLAGHIVFLKSSCILSCHKVNTMHPYIIYHLVI